MTEKQILFGIFVLLLLGLALPFSYGVRMGLFLALVAFAVAVLIIGGTQYVTSIFQ